jgi:hypothetical protein
MKQSLLEGNACEIKSQFGDERTLVDEVKTVVVRVVGKLLWILGNESATIDRPNPSWLQPCQESGSRYEDEVLHGKFDRQSSLSYFGR